MMKLMVPMPHDQTLLVIPTCELSNLDPYFITQLEKSIPLGEARDYQIIKELTSRNYTVFRNDIYGRRDMFTYIKETAPTDLKVYNSPTECELMADILARDQPYLILSKLTYEQLISELKRRYNTIKNNAGELNPPRNPQTGDPTS
jgi:hypothetical protein